MPGADNMNLNRRGADAGQWQYVVAMVLGLLALAFFAWIIIRARATDQSIFDQLGGTIGLVICFGRHFQYK